MSHHWTRILLSLVLVGATCPRAARGEDTPIPGLAAAADAAEPQDFGHLDFEDLRKIKVVTATRVAETLSGVPAAASVITHADIRRSGARTLPDVLRLAPGVEVGRINSRSYTVTVRGFNGAYANKLLPMIDGRSIYSQRFSGTVWDVRDVVLDDVDRIEVIRGPGGTAWGANAVNGVIHVLTRDARDTQGTLLSLGTGSLLRGTATVRHGFRVADDAWARVFARGFWRGDTHRLDGGYPHDDWGLARGGFRFDAAPGRAHWTVQGDVFTSEADQLLPPATEAEALTSGGYLQARGRLPGPAGETAINAYFDRLRRNSGGLRSHADVFEADVQHEFPDRAAHRVTIGATARYSRLEDWDALVGSVQSLFDPHVRRLVQAGLFAQDRFEAVPGRLALVAGCKLEYDDFTGAAPLPSLRVAWTPSATQTVWAAVSRATRIPSRAENDLTTITPGPFTSLPNPALEPEGVVAWEAGWRARPAEHLSVDVSAYYDAYDHLQGSLTSTTLAATSQQSNVVRGEAWGGEAELLLQVTPGWQVRGSLSWVEVALRRENPAATASSEAAESLSPAQQGSLRSSWTFGRGVEADLWYRHVGELPGRSAPVPAYDGLDARLSWQPDRRLMVSLSGQNLIEPLHQEFRFFSTRWEIPRGVTGEVTLWF